MNFFTYSYFLSIFSVHYTCEAKCISTSFLFFFQPKSQILVPLLGPLCSFLIECALTLE